MERWEITCYFEWDPMKYSLSGLKTKCHPGSAVTRVVAQLQLQQQPPEDAADTWDRTIIRRCGTPGKTDIAYKFGGPRFFGWYS